jgi:hypothetical protein
VSRVRAVLRCASAVFGRSRPDRGSVRQGRPQRQTPGRHFLLELLRVPVATVGGGIPVFGGQIAMPGDLVALRRLASTLVGLESRDLPTLARLGRGLIGRRSIPTFGEVGKTLQRIVAASPIEATRPGHTRSLLRHFAPIPRPPSGIARRPERLKRISVAHGNAQN